MNDHLFQITTWCVTTVALLGMALNARMNRWGFVCWTITNSAWIAVGVYKEIFAQAFQHVVYLFFSVYGFVSWTKRLNDGRAKQRLSAQADSNATD